MDAAWGVIIGAGVTSAVVFVNDLFRRRWEKRKWVIDKMEGAYLESLKLLSQSRRSPLSHKGQEYLESHPSYTGLMAAMLHVPAWMTMTQCYSSDESAKKIEPVRGNITSIVKELKSKEQQKTPIKGKDYVNDLGISKAIEDALPVVRECFERELRTL
jgi:hypothetical protein